MWKEKNKLHYFNWDHLITLAKLSVTKLDEYVILGGKKSNMDIIVTVGLEISIVGQK